MGITDDPQRTPRIAFAEPSGARYVLRLTPNGAEPLADSVASLDRALIVFTIGAGSDTTAQHVAEHVITSLNLNGRVHVVLEPLPAGDIDA
jgi:sarcosine oxidase gamma subunit